MLFCGCFLDLCANFWEILSGAPEKIVQGLWRIDAEDTTNTPFHWITPSSNQDKECINHAKNSFVYQLIPKLHGCGSVAVSVDAMCVSSEKNHCRINPCSAVSQCVLLANKWPQFEHADEWTEYQFSHPKSGPSLSYHPTGESTHPLGAEETEGTALGSVVIDVFERRPGMKKGFKRKC